MKISEIFCKSILTKSGIYGIDYAVNPYTGCQHNCAYCYAIFMKKFSPHQHPWGEFVDVKINAPTILKKQLRHTPSGRVLISSVTDAYQPLEARYELTRKCLQQFQKTSFFISILTKSSLAVRDIDVLKSLHCEVGFTLTTVDEAIKSVFEPESSSIKDRLAALQRFSDAHIPTYAFFGPLIPCISDTRESLESMFAAVDSHVQYVIVDTMNFYAGSWNRLRNTLQGWDAALIPRLEAIKKDPTYTVDLRKRVSEVASVPVEFCF